MNKYCIAACMFLNFFVANAQDTTGTNEQQPSLQLLKNKFGLELYSLRFEFKKDVPSTLASIKKMGITEIEGGSFYGLTPQQFKAALDKEGLHITSMLFDYNRYKQDLKGIIEEANIFGVKQLGFAWIPHEATFSKADADSAIIFMNDIGSKLKAAGFTFFYHPHGYEFMPGDSGTLFDYMAKHIKNASFQLDVFWAARGGADPVWLLNTYRNRFISLHVKDLQRGVATGDSTGTAPDSTSVIIGTGQVNWPEVLRAAIRAGIQHYYIEDEAENAIKQIPQSLIYLNNLQ